MDKEFWGGMKVVAENASAQRPSVGKRVIITKGLKRHLNKEGVVFWHAWDRHNYPTRYMNPAQITLTEIIGRYGWKVGITLEGGEHVFCSADNVFVLSDEREV